MNTIILFDKRYKKLVFNLNIMYDIVLKFTKQRDIKIVIVFFQIYLPFSYANYNDNSIAHTVRSDWRFTQGFQTDDGRDPTLIFRNIILTKNEGFADVRRFRYLFP